MDSTHKPSSLLVIIMKSITIVVCLCVTLASGLSPAEIEKIAELRFPQDSKCGIYTGEVEFTSPNNFPRVIFPWIMSITRKTDGKHLCDGVLIYPDVLMTNADCVKNDVNRKLMVTAKAMELAPRSSYSDRFERLVSKIHINPTYRACARDNNQAILILSKPFMLDRFINVACLPSVRQKFNSENCVKILMRDEEAIDHDFDHNHCGDRVFNDPGMNDSIRNASCEQGNETDAFIKESHSYSLSCRLAPTSKKFYYTGSDITVTMCGPDAVKYRFYDTLYKFLPWMYSVSKRRFVYYEPDEKPVWY